MAHLPETRESLLIRLADPDDQAAWEEFVTIYRNAVAGYCRSRGLQEADVQEVLQGVLLAVHRRVGDWKPSGRKNSFRVWLLRTAHRLCLKAIRDRDKSDRAAGGSSVLQRMREIPERLPKVKPDELDWQRWAFQFAARDIQSEVQPATWQAFWLSAVQGLPPEQVAEQLGMRVGTVYTSKCRVLAKIRERVQELSRSDA